MSDWKIELGREVPLITEVLEAQQIWKRLSKPARKAVAAAYTTNRFVYAHPLTIKALERHGFVVGIAYSSHMAALTDAGKRVAKWNVTHAAA